VDRRHAAIIQKRFARQAKAFAQSPLQNDPERLRRLIAFAAPHPGDRALDVACGPGIVSAALAAAGALAVGIDLTREMIREARGAGGGPYVRGEVERLPFGAGVFDLVLCRNSCHHFTEPSEVVREMARVVRPGGSVVIEDMRAPDDPAQREYHETMERLRDPSHTRTLTRGDLRGLLRAAGLVGLRDEPIAFVIDFDEWLDRAYPEPRAGRRARVMMEACIEDDHAGLRVWREEGRLKFERMSLLCGAVRPA
jgi:ubiquinone/menaquinone biosynthesis C-methylase UbiE